MTKHINVQNVDTRGGNIMKMIKTMILAGMLMFIVFGAYVRCNQPVYGEYKCDTDDECVQECLARCASKDGCRECYDIFISEDNYDLYERRYSELAYKYEAY